MIVWSRRLGVHTLGWLRPDSLTVAISPPLRPWILVPCSKERDFRRGHVTIAVARHDVPAVDHDKDAPMVTSHRSGSIASRA
jgi:hypothetical protein